MLATIITASFIIALLAILTIAGHTTDKLREKLKEEQSKREELDSQLSKMVKLLKHESDQDYEVAKKLVCFINVFSWTGYRESQIKEALNNYMVGRERYLAIVDQVKKEIMNEKQKTETQRNTDSISNS